MATNGLPRNCGTFHLVSTGVAQMAYWWVLFPNIPLPEKYPVLSVPDIFKGKERFDEARAIIVQYHANGDATHPIVNLEMSEMAESMQNGGMMTWKSTFDIRNLFNTRARRYRLALCIAFSWFGQFSGNNIASYVLHPLSSSNCY